MDGKKNLRREGQTEEQEQRITTAEAAHILGVSVQFVRVGLQQERLPIGTAVRMSSTWTYHISEKLLREYTGRDIRGDFENTGKVTGLDGCASFTPACGAL